MADNGIMNNTKWDELRLAMYALGDLHPMWRTKDRRSGYLSDWDGEWFYHFRLGGYDTIDWVDIATPDERQRDAVRACLQKIHVPGEETPDGFRVYGYSQAGKVLEYLAQLAEYVMHLLFGIQTVQGGPTKWALLLAGLLGIAFGALLMRSRKPPAHELPDVAEERAAATSQLSAATSDEPPPASLRLRTA